MLKPYLRIFLLLLLLSFTTFSARCQLIYPDVMPVFGGHTIAKSIQVTYTAGETFYETNAGQNSILTQGFNQIHSFTITDIAGAEPNIELKIYPNPAKDFIVLQTSCNKYLKLKYEVYDAQGKLLMRQNIENTQQQIDLSTLSGNIYFLRVFSSDDLIRVLKISKVN